jgi:hypothetical protein
VVSHWPAGIVVLSRGDDEIARWALGSCDHSDLGTINQLARLRLAAGRVGYAMRVRDACAELRGLIELTGLDLLLRQVGGQPEHLEQVGVEEVVVPDDPVV